MESERFKLFFEHFDSQGGNTPGGDDFAKGFNNSAERTRRGIAQVGQALIGFIDNINYGDENFSEEDTALARYYRYSIAVSLMGMSREEYLSAMPTTHREIEMDYMNYGAVLSAKDYMKDFTDSKVAFVVGRKAMDAPDFIHKLFFRQGMGRNALRFIKKHNPQSHNKTTKNS